MKIKDTLEIKGLLTIDKVYGWDPDPDFRKDMRVERVLEQEENVITNGGRTFLLSVLFTDSISNNAINQLRVGTGGTSDPQGLFPKLENPAWTNLSAYLLSTSTSYTNDPTVPSVTFLADVDQASGNGYLITEAGLFCGSGLMFNIKTFPGVPKTSEFSLHFSWTIQMA